MKKLTTDQLGIGCAVFLGLNLAISVLLFFIDDTSVDGQRLDRTLVAPKSYERLKATLTSIIISLPALAAVLGTITAIFIERNKPYSRRYLRGFLLTLAAIHVLFLLINLIGLATSI